MPSMELTYEAKEESIIKKHAMEYWSLLKLMTILSAKTENQVTLSFEIGAAERHCIFSYWYDDVVHLFLCIYASNDNINAKV